MPIRRWIIKLQHKIDSNLVVSLILVVVILCIYGQVRSFDFISLDDDQYVTQNPYVKSGLNRANIQWSFSFVEKDRTYWHPLTWISHMMDVSVYGLNSDRHHLTNVFFHMANCILLFVSLRRMTGALWRSALVAVLFAVHPINVESVAWVAERKNVLSTFFWMLSVLAYCYYVRRTTIYRYLMVCAVFTLGLLAKPMLVTLPFVLLLLDFWPLQRFAFMTAKGDNHKSAPNGTKAMAVCREAAHCLVLEKIPLFILAGISIYLSSASLKGAGNVISMHSIPIHLRITNALVSYLKYCFKLIWPVDMAVFYPYPQSIALGQAAACLAVLAIISVWVVRTRNRFPYLAVGWFWYLGTLVPVSGLVQAGLWPALADRWAYIPFIGLFIMISWGIDDLVKRRLYKTRLLLPGTFAVLIALTALAWNQTGYWASSKTLFAHAVKVEPNSWVTQFHLGAALSHHGDDAQAIQHYQSAITLNAGSSKTHHNMGNSLLALGQIDDAINHFGEALKRNPGFILAHNSLGLANLRTGRIEAAIKSFRRAVEAGPKSKKSQQNLNLALFFQDHINTAVNRMMQALSFSVNDAELNDKMQILLQSKRELAQAVDQFHMALSRQPGYSRLDPDNIVSVSTVKKEYERSLDRFKAITQKLPLDGDASYHIACIYARREDTVEALAWLERAMKIGFRHRDLLKIDSDLNNIRQATVSKELTG